VCVTSFRYKNNSLLGVAILMRRTRSRKASTAKWSLIRRGPSWLLGLFLYLVGCSCGSGVVLWAETGTGIRVVIFSHWDGSIWGRRSMCRSDCWRLVDGRRVIKALISSSSTDNDDDNNCQNCDATHDTSDRPSYDCRNVALGTPVSPNRMLSSVTTIL
jgi:hypothetical protein